MMSLKFTGLQKRMIPKLLVWLLAAVWVILVWPVGVFRDSYTSKSFADDDRQTDSVTEELPVIQEFRPQYDRLRSIGFVLNRGDGEVTDGTVTLKVYDSGIQLLFQQEFSMEQVEDGKYTEAEMNLDVTPGELYYFRIEVNGLTDGAPTLSYRSLLGCGPEENGALYYGTTVVEDGSAVCRYEYGRPVGILQILTYDSFGVLIGMMLTVWITKRQENRKNRV